MLRATKYREANRDKVNAYRREYGKKRPEKIHEYNQKHYYKNQSAHLEYHVNYRQAVKLEVIEAYGGACQCCGEREPSFLSAEHVHGYKERPDLYAHIPRGGTPLYLWLRKNGFPKENFAVWCFNCNLGKEKSSDGKCPHEHQGIELRLVSSC